MVYNIIAVGDELPQSASLTAPSEREPFGATNPNLNCNTHDKKRLFGDGTLIA